MAGLILPVDFDIKKAEAKLNKLNREFDISKEKAGLITKEIEDTSKALNEEKLKQAELRDIIKDQVEEMYKLETIVEKIQNGEASMQEIIDVGGLDAAKVKLQEMQTAIQKNEQAFTRSAEKSQNLTRELDKQKLRLNEQNHRTRTIGDNIKLATDKSKAHGLSWLKTNKNIKKSQSSMSRFGRRIKELVKSALIFTVLTKALNALKEAFSELINKEGTKTAALVSKLKGNLATIGVTLYESMRPAIEWILQKLVEFTQVLANGLAKILGKNVKEMAKLAKNTEDTAEAAKKATAGFDTLQTIDTSSQKTDASESKSAPDTSVMEKPIDESVARIFAIVSGALLVLGVILTFTGVAIPLGIALIAIGAVGLVATVTPAWNSLDEPTKNTIAEIVAIVSAAFLVLGVILAFTGVNIPLGIAFIALGAVGLAKAYKERWDALDSNVQNTITVIVGIVSAALLLLGVVLAFTGVNIPLGIAFIALGAVGLASAAKIGWKSLPDKTKNIISMVMAIGGALLLVIGIILCFTGAGIPLGIALIAIGAAGLAGAAALNWDYLKEKVKSICEAISGFFKKMWDGVRNIINKAIGGVESFVNGIIGGINWLINKLNWVLGEVNGLAKMAGVDANLHIKSIPEISIPRLATGAVIPGGSPFLAMLGDQRRGQTNIETPLETMVEAFKQAQAEQNFTVKATGSMSQLIKLLNLKIEKENTRATMW